VWFAPDESRPLLAFAGLWTNWTAVRKAKEGEITADIFAFLTCEPNAEVGRIHPEGHAGDSDDDRGTRHLAKCPLG
jgi:putative SOS response-associated peptidase YedK